MLGLDRTERKAEPYSQLARIYDFVMRHVDYGHWADYVVLLLARHGAEGEQVLDLACGTGSLALELNRRGYCVAGVDGSPEMLDQAKSKARERCLDIPFDCRDLLDLGGLPRYPVALCLYDSLNYLLSLEAIGQSLRQVRRVLEPGGLFICDVCTESNSVRYFSDLNEREKGKGFSYTRQSHYEDGVQYNRFKIRFRDSSDVLCEEHRQRIYPLAEIEQIFEDSCFAVEGAYDGFGLTPPTGESDRVHFVLRAGGRTSTGGAA